MRLGNESRIKLMRIRTRRNFSSRQPAQVADKASVKLRFTSPEGTDVSVSQSDRQPTYPITRAEQAANGKAMTDLYIFDYD